MPRPPRIQLEGALYYVTCRALRNEKIFKDDADYKLYLDLLSKYKNRLQFKLFAYYLFSDQLHLLVETGSGATISEILHDLNTSYTKYFNTRYNKRGPLFEPRFKSMLVEKSNYLLKMTRYINEAPRRENKEPREYPYGSFQFYLRRSEIGLPLIKLHEEIAEVIALLKEPGSVGAYERYCQTADPTEMRELKKQLSGRAVLGSDVFVEEVNNRIKQVSQEKKESVPASRLSAVKWLLLASVIILLGMVFLLAYFYREQSAAQVKYKAFLNEKEQAFAERTRFENRSPLALTELNGTEWTIEVLFMSDRPQAPVKDKIRFKDGHFSSEYFAARGFQDTAFSVVLKDNGVRVWEAVLIDLNGDKVSWRGVWQGGNMKGILSQWVPGQAPRNFSFYGLGWRYLNVSGGNR